MRCVTCIQSDRQRKYHAIGNRNGCTNVAVEIIDLEVANTVFVEHVNVIVRTCAYVRSVWPRLT